MNLKQKILIRFLLVAIIPISFLGFFFYIYAYNIITEDTIKSLTDISTLQKKRILELIDRNFERVSSLAISPSLISTLSTYNVNANSTRELENFLELKKLSIPEIQRISVLNLDGYVIASTDNTLDGKLFYDSNIYKIGKRNAYVDIALNDLGKRSIFLSTPVKQNQIFYGTLIIEENLDKLSLIMQDYTGLGKTGDLLLVKIDEGRNLQTIVPSRFSNWSRSDPSIQTTSIDEPIIRASLGQESRFTNVVDNNGNKMLVVTSYFPETQWGLIVKINNDEAFAGIEYLKQTILALSILLILMAIVFSVLLSKTISEPINKLRLSCRSIAKGDLRERIEVTSNEDEYRDLICDVNYMVNEMKKTERSKNEFISMISHELKTPLIPIIGYVEMLSDPNLLGNLKPPQSEALSIVYSNAKRLVRIIDDLLVSQGLELNYLKFDKNEIHTKDFLENIVSSNRITTNKKNIKLVNSTKDDIVIFSDGARLAQIFNNLIQNAMDFTQQNGRIEIGAKLDYDKVVFFVKDNGTGIPKEKQGSLFKKFYQVDTSLTRTHGGTGLGLSICKGLIEGMQGKIWVESEEGKGSTFYFSLPNKNS